MDSHTQSLTHPALERYRIEQEMMLPAGNKSVIEQYDRVRILATKYDANRGGLSESACRNQDVIIRYMNSFNNKFVKERLLQLITKMNCQAH